MIRKGLPARWIVYIAVMAVVIYFGGIFTHSLILSQPTAELRALKEQVTQLQDQFTQIAQQLKVRPERQGKPARQRQLTLPRRR